MTKLKVVIFVGFLMAFGAGLVVGAYAYRALVEDRQHLSPLVRELDLNAAQAEQVQRIWSAMRDGWRGQEDRRKAARKERDDALAGLLTDRKAACEPIEQRYASAMADLAEQRSKAVKDAVERTKQLLTEEQRAKYEELLKKRESEGRGQGRRSDDRSTSRPATNP